MKTKNMINTNLNLSINEPLWETALPNLEELGSQVVSLAVNFVNDNEPLDFFALGKPLTFNLCLSNDDEVHSLNREFRGMNKPTNVLSFANIDDEDFDNMVAAEPEIEMGDMIIALETMQREAELKHISLRDHFCHLLTHSVLHLLGYDHIEDNDAEHMENFEVRILNLLNIANPYQDMD